MNAIPHLVVCPQMQHIMLSMPIHMHNAADVFKLLDCEYQELMLDHLIEY
jgi:hypothetical protein